MKTPKFISMLLAAGLLFGIAAGCGGEEDLRGGQGAAVNDSGTNNTAQQPIHLREAVVEDLAGSVTALTSGDETPAFRGLALLRQDSVRTGAESWTSLELAEGQFALIEENASVEISELADNAAVTEIALNDGKMWFIISSALGGDDRFIVKTPNSTMSVRGTVFSVQYRDGATHVAVYDGIVSVEAGDEVFDVSRGEVAEIVSQDGTVTEVRREQLQDRDLKPLYTDGSDGPSGMYAKLRGLVPEISAEIGADPVPKDPQTFSDYAKIYYRYIQEVLIPEGIKGMNDFIDADIAYLYGEDIPTLMVSSSLDLVYFDYNEYKYNKEESTVLLMGGYYIDGPNELYDVSTKCAYINQYDDVLQLFIYSYNDEDHLANNNNSDDAISEYLSIYFRDDDKRHTNIVISAEIRTNVDSGNVRTFGRYKDENTGEDYRLDYEEAKALIDSYLNPISTFCVFSGNGEPPFPYENTNGERLRDYFD